MGGYNVYPRKIDTVSQFKEVERLLKKQASLSIAQKPLHPVFLYLFWAHVFFAFQLNLGAFCSQFVDVNLNFDTLKLNWVTKIGIFRISGLNLSHLGADLSILGAKKRFRGVKYP
jgi:hypothetical protein